MTRDTSEPLTRLSVNLNQKTADALRASAVRGGITFTEAVRRAISILSYIESEIDAGRKIQTMDSDDHNKREMVIV